MGTCPIFPGFFRCILYPSLIKNNNLFYKIKHLLMKNLLFFAFFTLLLFSKNLIAQVSKVIPPEADDFYNKSMPLLRPQVKNIVLNTAKAIENCKINADSLSRALRGKVTLKGMSNNDIEGVIVLIMVQASKDADTDLKRMVLEISHKNDQK